MSDVEAIQPDEVTSPGSQPAPGAEQPGVAVEKAPEAAPSALAAAADAALAMPGVAGHSEFWSLAAQARVLSLSGAAPKQVRENPHIALHVAMVGRDLGISPSAALELIDVISTGGQVRLSLSPQLLNGQVRRLGLGEVVAVERSDTRCVAAAIGPGGTDRRCRVTGVLKHVEGCTCDVVGYSEFTWEDARIAELVGPKCQPGQHVKDQNRSSGGRTWKVCGCNQGYITYPKRMLWWRASGFVVDDYFPEAGLGLYTAEELGAVVDDKGRPIDVTSVEVPPGYEPAELPQAQRQQQAEAQRERRADPEQLFKLQVRIHSLPDGHKAELSKAWINPESRLRGERPFDLPARLMRQAEAMVNAFWGRAQGANLDEATMTQLLYGQLADVIIEVGRLAMFGCTRLPGDAAGAPVAAAEPQAAPEPPAGAVEADSEPQGPPGEEPDWAQLLRDTAAAVVTAAEGVPGTVVERITRDVKALHWKAVDDELTEHGVAEHFPHEAPIDLRRMAVCLARLTAFRSAGVVPGGDG